MSSSGHFGSEGDYGYAPPDAPVPDRYFPARKDDMSDKPTRVEDSTTGRVGVITWHGVQFSSVRFDGQDSSVWVLNTSLRRLGG